MRPLPGYARRMNRPEPMARAESATADAHSGRGGRIGVLIVNLGTPDATDAASVRRYLREFLSDARVIEDQGLLWKFVLNAIILTTRPRRKGRDYEKIWNRKKNESPLKTVTRAQAGKLRQTLDAVDPTIVVDWAMRYGNPSLETRIEALAKAGCERILLLVGDGEETFRKDFRNQDTMMRSFQVLGESAKKISGKTRDRWAEVPWREMARM